MGECGGLVNIILEFINYLGLSINKIWIATSLASHAPRNDDAEKSNSNLPTPSLRAKRGNPAFFTSLQNASITIFDNLKCYKDNYKLLYFSPE